MLQQIRSQLLTLISPDCRCDVIFHSNSLELVQTEYFCRRYLLMCRCSDIRWMLLLDQTWRVIVTPKLCGLEQTTRKLRTHRRRCSFCWEKVFLNLNHLFLNLTKYFCCQHRTKSVISMIIWELCSPHIQPQQLDLNLDLKSKSTTSKIRFNHKRFIKSQSLKTSPNMHLFTKLSSFIFQTVYELIVSR